MAVYVHPTRGENSGYHKYFELSYGTPTCVGKTLTRAWLSLPTPVHPTCVGKTDPDDIAARIAWYTLTCVGKLTGISFNSMR